MSTKEINQLFKNETLVKWLEIEEMKLSSGIPTKTSPNGKGRNQGKKFQKIKKRKECQQGKHQKTENVRLKDLSEKRTKKLSKGH